MPDLESNGESKEGIKDILNKAIKSYFEPLTPSFWRKALGGGNEKDQDNDKRNEL